MSIVLLVDDDKDILKLGSHVLSANGHFVFTAENAEEAFEHLNLRTIDLVITDANMPRHSGFDLLKTLKTNSSFKHIPVAFLTGRRGKEDIELAMNLGVVDYIVKPLDPFLLIQKTNQILSYNKKNSFKIDLALARVSTAAQLKYNIKVCHITEVGIEVTSSEKLEVGLKVEIDTPLFKEIGIKAPLMKVLNCIEDKKEQHHLVKIQFIGIGENDLSKIRAWMLKNASYKAA